MRRPAVRRPARPAPPVATTVEVTPAGTATAPPDLVTTASVLALQRRAGNAAVNKLVQRAHPGAPRRQPAVKPVQRAPLDKADDPELYTQPGGHANVRQTGLTRVEVHGLKFGLKGGFQPSYTGSSGAVPSSEKAMTKESPLNMAVLIRPDTIDATRPVQVILHFAGWGFRQIDGGTHDPYPGYLVASGATASKKGTVRDVDQEHWEQQIKSVMDRRSTYEPQVIAVLAQGRGMSDFGDVPTYAYIQDVFDKAGISVPKYSVVLSGHSGGGFQVANKVGDAEAVDAAKLPAGSPRAKSPDAADLVVMYDAEGVVATANWAAGQIKALGKALDKIDKDVTNPLVRAVKIYLTLAASPKFRGYFAKGGYYVNKFDTAATVLKQALDTLDPKWTTLDPGVLAVPDLFRVIEVGLPGVNHEHVIGAVAKMDPTTKKTDESVGALADALTVTMDPTSDRAAAYVPKAAAKAKAATTKAKPPATTAKPPASVQQLQRTPTAQRDDTKPKPPPAWRASGAAGEYAFTEDDRKALAAQTADERAADQARITKDAIKRIEKLEKAKKKAPLSADEEKELTDLQTVKARTEQAQRALKRLDVEEVLTAAGTTVTAWFGGVVSGTFLGLPLRVHKHLGARLTQAETALLADTTVNPGKVDAKTLGQNLNMTARTSDLRKPALAVGGTSLSMHTFGLAVDLNYTGSPFIGNASPGLPGVVRRATSLCGTAAVNVMDEITDPTTAYDTLKGASDALALYLSFHDRSKAADLKAQVDKHTALRGEPRDAAGWQKQIDKDFKDMRDARDFNDHTPATQGFLDLNKAVVLALTGAGLTWGGTYPGAKDLMHFDLRDAEGAKIQAARTAHTANT
ncbi:MAG TPA: M15 family metallopeptidase [Micromonosporaceae bacterium]|nr:M15 family metallopeptidase [Micromonosporaceae bacterium]